ncbi:hypothetical protein [Rhodanobacter hydrolyticus]|uniref:TM2 domain-containing protein n=1 Tax=Rhodanobacter hydrolyticus TaxID=2250595 RepID=A0ABW8J9X1_9GAMM
MSDEDAECRASPSWSKVRNAAFVVAGLVYVACRLHPFPLGTWEKDWACVGMGGLFVWSALLDIRLGVTMGLHTFKQYKRSDDAVTFWMTLAFPSLAGGFLMVGALGDLLGFWNWRNW